MPIYETVLIARQELGTPQVEALTADCTRLLESLGGSILKTEQWGLRTLAYRIGKSRKGHYVLIESNAPAAAVLELERTLRLNEDVLRYLTIKLEEPSKGQSAILDRDRERSERGDREGGYGRDRGDREGGYGRRDQSEQEEAA